MSSFIIISIFINVLMYSNAVYLVEQANYYKPKLERNNILNKGLWRKDKVEKSNYGDFIFRADSGDVDNIFQNNFDAFGENYMDAIPVFSNYVERNKRSTFHKKDQRAGKSLRNCNDKINCENKGDDKQPHYKSKFISQLRPASVFNDYPYEVAVLLANTIKREIKNDEETNIDLDHKTKIDENVDKKLMKIAINENNKTKETDFESLNDTARVSYNKTSFPIPKRRMTSSDLQLELNGKIKPFEENNNTKHIDGNKINRNVFDKEEKVWQSVPIQSMVLPRPESSVSNKPITEKGLVKILALLTKTFKKVMKQHNEIQEIDNKLHILNNDFMKNVAVLDTKLQEFDTKCNHMVKINEELQNLKENLMKKNYDIERKERVMSKNLKDFENQQKMFLSQQHQFYTIQKFMLEQNEKINRKQSIITKTQSEISHRQNHFARILKKAKQFYIDNKFPTGPKLSLFRNKSKNSSTIQVENPNKVTLTTPAAPVTTDTVKINLFSIPKIGPLLNHDKLILEEKNDQSIDDLVYKYYFNNSFLDNLMKSKVLTAFLDNEGKGTRNTKNKRNNLISDTTILLPINNVNKSPMIENVHRERRWIQHPNKISRPFHGNEPGYNDRYRKRPKNSKSIAKANKKNTNDPYLIMASNFCIEVGQNQNDQMLNWCVEKSLRRLKTIDMILPINPLASPPVENTSQKVPFYRGKEVDSDAKTTKLFPFKSSNPVSEPIYTSIFPAISTPETFKNTKENEVITEKASDLFFPDNDELESNLKQYELKADPEGTVYFDGSLHTSDIVISESDGLSDIMPGLDSNSHVDVDPLALDLQARRRANVRRLNENIQKTMTS